MTNSKVIAVVNQKGGVTKTTTTVNLGVGLALQGKKVLLVDADPQGDLTTSLGWPDNDNLPITLATLTEKVINDEPIDPQEGILHHAEGVDLVPANMELSGMEVALVGAMSREFTLKSYLDTVKGAYNFVLIESARDLLTAVILYFYNLGMMFIETMIKANGLGYKELIDTIRDGKCDIAKKFINEDVLLNPKMYAGISATFRNHIRIFATDTTIQNTLSPSDDPDCELITWEDLETHDIFVRIDQRRLDQWGRVVGMLITQLIRTLESRPSKHSPEGEKLEPVLLLLDEFPRLGKVEMIVSSLEVLRDKKVTIVLFCQSLADLDDIYGDNTRCRIMDNCHFKAILNAGDLNSQQVFSSLVGTKSVVVKGINASYSFDQGDISGVSINLSESSQPVIPPHEFATLKCIVLLHPEGFSFVDNPSHMLPGHPKNPDNRLYMNP